MLNKYNICPTVKKILQPVRSDVNVKEIRKTTGDGCNNHHNHLKHNKGLL